MERGLRYLSSEFYPRACALIAELTGKGIQVLIVQTLRTKEEHLANLASGASSTLLSKHLPREMRRMAEEPDRCDAIDIVPYSIFNAAGPDKLNWDTSDPVWLEIGKTAEAIDRLRWGGRWSKPVDPGHIELVFGRDLVVLAEERGRPWPPPALKTRIV